MAAPSFALQPPSPNRTSNSRGSPSPSSSSGTSAFSLSESIQDPPRSSCETAIVTIYSMYGDATERESWGASSSGFLDPNMKVLPPKDVDTVPDNYRTDYLIPCSQSASVSTIGLPPPIITTPFRQPNALNNSFSTPNIRPSSNIAFPSFKLSVDDVTRRASTGQNLRCNAAVTAPLAQDVDDVESNPSGSRPTSRTSRTINSSDTSYDRAPSGPSGSSLTPATSLLPIHRTSSPSASFRSKVSSPGSQISITRSENEEPDAFYIRSTYAQLDLLGVKGDGYEDGIERTRARIGASRASQLTAEQALGDGTEKRQELTPQEIETLGSLDRYGFYTLPSHDRLVLLTTKSLSRRLSPISAGPPSAPSSGQPLPSLPSITTPAKEYSRIKKWNSMIIPTSRDPGGNVESWGVKSSKESKLRERVYKGIPDRWRRAAWEVLISRFAKTGKEELTKLGEDFREALDLPSTFDVQIDLDVPRTISGHVMFRTRYGAGQRALFHVLHCLSLRCPDCGYVQGMGPLAATLLCYFDAERVYACLVRLHDSYSMHSIFSPGFPGLLEAIYVQERIMEQMMPDVYEAFKKNTVSTTAYATKWYITLFANSVPFQTQLRLWDAFLLEGPELFVVLAVGIVWAYRDQITSASANFETMLSLLSSFFVPEDEDALLAWIEKALGDKKLRTNMTGWRQTWRDLVASVIVYLIFTNALRSFAFVLIVALVFLVYQL